MEAEDYFQCRNNTTFPNSRRGVMIASMTITSVVSTLSIAGCLLIMFTYLAYKSLRTKGRAMLFHLSIADLIVVISHLVGLWNYKRYLTYPDAIPESNKDPLCVSQGAFLVFGTVASMLWSNAVGIFMLVLVVNGSSKYKKINSVVYIASCIVCWLIPAVLVAVNAGKHYLGFHTIGSTNCYIINVADNNNSVQTSGYQVAEVFSYEVWVYLTFIILPVIYAIIFFYTKCKLKTKGVVHKHSSLEMKLLLVPIVFVLLRIWSTVTAAFAYFKFSSSQYNYGCLDISVAILLLDDVGINAQGFANAILFCILTQAVRKKLVKSSRKLLQCLECNAHRNDSLMVSTSLSEEELLESTNSKRSYKSINDNDDSN